MNNLDDEYLSIKDLSAYSKLGDSTIRYHIRNSGLPCFQIPGKKEKAGKILIRREEFDQWMEQYRINISIDLEAIANEMVESLNRV